MGGKRDEEMGRVTYAENTLEEVFAIERRVEGGIISLSAYRRSRAVSEGASEAMSSSEREESVISQSPVLALQPS